MKWCGHGRLFSKWFIGHLHRMMVWLGSRTAVEYCITVCAACLNTYCTVQGIEYKKFDVLLVLEHCSNLNWT
jgi:hypothetical protein